MSTKLFLGTNYFFWEPNIYVFNWNNFELRWYAVLFVLAAFAGRFVVVYIYKKERKYDQLSDLQLVYMLLGNVLGARIGHILFYNPEVLSIDFLELFKFWKSGLASHGAAIGVLVAMSFYSFDFKIKGFKIKVIDRLKNGNTYLQIMDRIVVGVALGACLVRVGNFVNSEIIGKPTKSNYGVVLLNPFSDKLKQDLPFVETVDYEKTGLSMSNGYPILNVTVHFKNQKYFEQRIRSGVDRLLLKSMPIKEGAYSHVINPKGSKLKYTFTRTNNAFYLNYEAVGVARHPVQLYEALTCFLLFTILFWVWYKKKTSLQPGILLGSFLVILFSMRILHEQFKENQVSFENEMALNMGQLLSIPFIIFGIFLMASKNRSMKYEKLIA